MTGRRALSYGAALAETDPVALSDACAPSVVFSFPGGSRLMVVGERDLRVAFGAMLEAYGDLRSVEELGDGDTQAIHVRGHAGSEDVHILRLDGWGKVEEIRVIGSHRCAGLAGLIARNVSARIAQVA